MKHEELSRALEFLDEDLLLEADAARTATVVRGIHRPHWKQFLKQPRNWISAACILLSVSLLAVTLLLGSMHGFYLGPLEIPNGETGEKKPSNLWEQVISFENMPNSSEEFSEWIQDENCVVREGLVITKGNELLREFYLTTMKKKPATLIGINKSSDSTSMLFYEIVYDGQTYLCTTFEDGDVSKKKVEEYRFLNSESEIFGGELYQTFVLTNYEDIYWSDISRDSLRSDAVYAHCVYLLFLGYLKIN
ncbi:MAG: hypothetical protein IJX28_05430 [Clostridia bacterium]|nr:hypothetical protein [Clostridia bacterium]